MFSIIIFLLTENQEVDRKFWMFKKNVIFSFFNNFKKKAVCAHGKIIRKYNNNKNNIIVMDN